MSGLALVPAWFWIALGTILALAGLVAGVIWSRHARYRPERRAGTRTRARHIIREVESPYVLDDPVPDFYGSMDYDAELDYRAQYGFVPAPPGWRAGEPVPLPRAPYWPPADDRAGEPTEAEVAASRAAHGYIPELDSDWPPETPESGMVMVWRDGHTHYEHPDPGPGVLESSLAPGPDFERLCGPEQPHEKPAGTESAGSGHLGPHAQAVWDRYQERHQERWAFA